jgi:hypothetical protein
MKLVFVLTALLVTKKSVGQYNDWTEYGLKGKVRLIESTVFDSAVYDGKTWKPVGALSYTRS